MLRYVAIALLCVLAAGPMLAAGDEQALRENFQRARELSTLKEKGVPGFQLSADVRVWVKKDAVTNGKYKLTWDGESQWKEEIVFPGYRRTRVGNQKQYWQVRSTAGESPQVYELSLLLERSPLRKLADDDKIKAVHADKSQTTEASCVKVTTAKHDAWTYCFEAFSNLVKYQPEKESQAPWVVGHREYSNYAKWGDRYYPRRISGYNGKELLMEAEFDEIKPLPELPKNFFDVPKDSSVWLDCSAVEAWKLKDKVQPIYPQDARTRRVQGTVVVYAVTEENGQTSNLAIANSVDKALDDSAMSAISKWRYERTDACPNAQGRSEAMVEVVYSLQY